MRHVWFSRSFLLIATIAQAAGAVAARAETPEPASPASALPSLASASYYPHWVTRDGEVTPAIMTRLAPGTIIGAHHRWSSGDIGRILEFPNKQFRIAWYAESNVYESDDPTPKGTSVKTRIGEARRKQRVLAARYGKGRFADLIELDGSRDKKDGHLLGRGNAKADWLADAAAAKAEGFRLIAKSPALAHVDELRAKLGREMVPRIVFEDVTASPGDANPGYRRDAKALAARREHVTLVIHEGAYGGFAATPLAKARSVVALDFGAASTEAYWGRATSGDGFMLIKPLRTRIAKTTVAR